MPWDSISICAGWRRPSAPSGRNGATTERRNDGTAHSGLPQPPEVVFDKPAHLPDRYIADDDTKLDLYRRLARGVSSGEIDELRQEMRERFGPLPEEADRLLDLSRLRVLGGALGNILDRVRHGYVVDFADLHFGEFRPFFIFNVADAAISIGVAILLLRAFLVKESPKENAEHA